MKSLLERIDGLDELISKMQKMESRLRSGEIIDAWRECTRIIAVLYANKRQIILNEQKDKEAKND